MKKMKTCVIIILSVSVMLMMCACGKTVVSESEVGKNESIVSSIQRVPFEDPDVNEEDIHKKGSKKEDYTKLWKNEDKSVLTITSDIGELYAVSEIGNGTDNYSIEIMPCDFKDEQLKYGYSQIIECQKVTETTENCNAYDGGEGYLELITKIPEAGKNGNTAKGSWDVIDQNGYLLWERYY